MAFSVSMVNELFVLGILTKKFRSVDFSINQRLMIIVDRLKNEAQVIQALWASGQAMMWD